MEFTVCFVDAGIRTSKVIDVDESLLGLDANSTPEEITAKAYYLLHKEYSEKGRFISISANFKQ